jgi:hypothetical protein
MRMASSASSARSREAVLNRGILGGRGSSDILAGMALSETRIRAEAAFLARRLLSEKLVATAAPAELRRALEAVLVFDRERERQLDDEVKAILQKNAPALRAQNVDYAEMVRKAKRMLAEKKKIPL